MTYKEEINFQADLMQAVNPKPYLLLAEGLYRAEMLPKEEGERLAAELRPLALQVRDDREALTLFRWHFITRKLERRRDAVTEAATLCDAYFPFLKEYVYCSIDDLSAYAEAVRFRPLSGVEEAVSRMQDYL